MVVSLKHLEVKKSTLQGSLKVPSSKSQTHRALIFAALAKGESIIDHLLLSPDTYQLISCLQKLGAKIRLDGDRCFVEGVNGRFVNTKSPLDVGNSGIALRFLTALVALSQSTYTLTGDQSLCLNRPMEPLCQALISNGVAISYLDQIGRAPITVRGPFTGGEIHVNGADSQPVSALLMAAAFAENLTTILVNDPGELPWVDLTLLWLEKFGVSLKREGYSKYYIEPISNMNRFEYSVPGDWSSAAFPIAASLITGSELVLENVDIENSQGDKQLINILTQMGAEIELDPKTHSLKIPGNQRLHGIDVDINHCIDVVTILSVVACFAKGKTRIYNAKIAREKECDRLSCTAKELKKMGASIYEKRDGLEIFEAKIRGASVDSHGDHRLAMSLAIAGLAAKGSSIVQNVDCISKTYPSFISDFRNLGATL